MGFRIDGAFIASWEPMYDRPLIGDDEQEYLTIRSVVAEELAALNNTISKATFLRIWAWKGATRVLWRMPIYVRPTHDFDTGAATPAQDEFASLYQPRFRSTFGQISPEDKVNRLVMDWVKGKQLPGVGLPTASTLVHFFHPTTVPIFDQRTVRTLFRAGYTAFSKSENCYMRHYAIYCRVLLEIQRDIGQPTTLRKIDRAIFSWDKLNPPGEPAYSDPEAAYDAFLRRS